MDEKSKKKKKLKQKQKQRQKQNQTVIVNVNSVKSTRRPSKAQIPRVQIPPPIHKVYASPIHDLTPQMFNKEGKQETQPTLAEQIGKYLKGQEQSKQGNVLGSEPNPNKDALFTFGSSKKNQPVSTDKFKNAGKRRGRPPGALGKGPTKAELRNENKSQSAVLSSLASQAVKELKANKKEAESVQPTNLPSQFVQETTYLPKSSITETGEQVESFYPPSPSNLNDILINQTANDIEQFHQPADDEEQEIPFYESPTYPSTLNFFQSQLQEETKSEAVKTTKKKYKKKKLDEL